MSLKLQFEYLLPKVLSSWFLNKRARLKKPFAFEGEQDVKLPMPFLRRGWNGPLVSNEFLFCKCSKKSPTYIRVRILIFIYFVVETIVPQLLELNQCTIIGGALHNSSSRNVDLQNCLALGIIIITWF